jgi:hypothetical protein
MCNDEVYQLQKEMTRWQRAYTELFQTNERHIQEMEWERSRAEYYKSQLAPQHPCNIDNDPDDDGEELAANAGWLGNYESGNWCTCVQNCRTIPEFPAVDIDPNCPVHGNNDFRGNV